MFIEQFYSESDQGISFTRQQASNFAKQIANDFNPIHNADAKRFCVPGDLLFAVTLDKSGVYEKMDFTFSGMVTDGVHLQFPEQINETVEIKDNNDKAYLSIAAQGNSSKNEALLSSLIKAYVAFSGLTFPHILGDLMKKHQVMINPTRPMVMYQSMEIELDHFDAEEVELKLSTNSFEHNGKRGKASLFFDLLSKGEIIGRGKKYMTLSGLREYCQASIDQMVNEYNQTKESFTLNK